MPTLIALAILVVIVLTARALVVKFTVRDYEAGLLYLNGRLDRQLSPGGHFLFRPGSRCVHVDLRMRSLTVPAQDLLSADNVPLRVTLLLRISVCDPVTAVHKVHSYLEEAYATAQLAARDEIGRMRMDDILQRRAAISEALTTAVVERMRGFGLEVHALELKDVTLPGELKRVFSAVACAEKEAQAKLERARGETATLRHLANAAKMMEHNPALMNLRVLQLLDGSSHTIVLGGASGLAPLGTESGKAKA